MAGRFVNIIIPGERKTLTLCEVEVYAAPEGTTQTHSPCYLSNTPVRHSQKPVTLFPSSF